MEIKSVDCSRLPARVESKFERSHSDVAVSLRYPRGLRIKIRAFRACMASDAPRFYDLRVISRSQPAAQIRPRVSSVTGSFDKKQAGSIRIYN